MTTDKARIILNQLKSGNLTSRAQAFDNLTCFTHPSNLQERIKSLCKLITEEFEKSSTEEKKRLVKFLTWLTIALDGSCELRLNLQDRKRHGSNALTDTELEPIVQDLLTLLEEFESKDKELVINVLRSEKSRLTNIMSTKGTSLFAVKAQSADTTSSRNWISYWSEFSKSSHLRKFREEVDGLIGVDYGLGVFESRIFWGANLVMMNPTLARLALAEDDELQAMKVKLAERYADRYPKERLVREATKVAGLKARLALRAVFLLTGKGKISFQVNPRTYNQPHKLEEDIRSLYQEFNQEALEYDSGLFLDEVLTLEEIKQRKGQTHVFFKVDGSSKNVYGEIEEVMLKQVKEGKIDLTQDDTGGVMERVMSDGMNCNVTVAGFVTDGLWAFFSQIRGHSKARKKAHPRQTISHSIITKMGGRVEASLRWIALQKLATALKEKNNPAVDTVLKADHTKNGTLEDPSLRKLAKEAGFVLPEEITRADYEKHERKLFPQDTAICTIAEAISKRSHRIIGDLKKHRILREQGVEEWETGDLQASMRPPYAGRFAHVEELTGMYAQGHFPDIALAIEQWKDFDPDPGNINKPVDQEKIAQLYSSIIGEEFAKAYQVSDELKEILTFFGVYKEEYGNKGIKIDELYLHPFSQQTLFGEVLDKIPQTDEEKDQIKKGFVGDFNLLYDELVAV